MDARQRPLGARKEASDVATIRLRKDQLAKFRRLSGITTDDALATRMGVNAATVSRVLRGTAAPGERFIAGLLLVFGIECFPDLFEVIADAEEVA
jgi:transcriptional regulator with XRE-family HTH domain